MKNFGSIPLFFFGFLIISESFILPFTARFGDINTLSILYFLTGLLIAILPLIFKNPIHKISTKKVSTLLSMVLLFILSFSSFHFIIKIIDSPINPNLGDMLPVIKIMNERFLRGELPNNIMYELWGGAQAVYLPMMWLPYLPAIIFDFDMRYVSLFLFVAGVVSLFFIKNKERNMIGSFVFLIAIATILAATYRYYSYTFVYCQEGVVMFYYILLSLSMLYFRNPFFSAAAITFCLLSRYSFLPWMLFYFVWMFFFKNEKKWTIYTGSLVFLFSLSIMFFTKAIYNYEVFLNTEKTYMVAFSDSNRALMMQSFINEGIGLAKFFYHGNFKTYMLIFKLAYLFSPFLFFAVFYKKITKQNETLFLLCCLKFSLLIFYNFFLQPHHYLFYVSNIISFSILVAYSRIKTEEEKQNLIY